MSELQGAQAARQFEELFRSAEAAGERLVDIYRAQGADALVEGTLGQLSWLRSRRDLVLDGELLPGGGVPFGLTRMFADLARHADDGAFEDACGRLQEFWSEGLGAPGWDWRQGLPPGWARRPAKTDAS